jgi:hypothetical protein
MVEPVQFSDDVFTDEPTAEDLAKGKPLFLGVIGSRTDATEQKIREEIMNPILQELGRPPDRLLLPEEGTSSIFLSDWADSLKLPNQVYTADWQRHQRRAKIFRDARIQEESTHFLIFLNKRSDFNEKLATRLARKGHMVFTVSYSDWSLELLELTDPPSSSCQIQKSPPLPSCSPATRGRKRGTGTTQVSHQLPPSKGLGSQQQLTSLWAI